MSNIKLSNKGGESLLICLEPEGSIFELPVNEYVEISLNENTLPLELIYAKYEEKNIISIWPNKEFPHVIYKGNNLLG